MRIRYYGIGSSAPRTSTREPHDYAAGRQVLHRRYTLGVLAAVSSYDSGELPQVPGEIRFRCACCGTCPPDACAYTCDQCYCDTSQQKYLVTFSEPPTKEDETDCEECQNFGDGGDGCCGDLCWIIQQTSPGSPCQYESQDINFCGYVWKIGWTIATDAKIRLSRKDDPTIYAEWCYSSASVDSSTDTFTCPGYTCPIDCTDAAKPPFGQANAETVTPARWHYQTKAGDMPCNWLVGAHTGHRVHLTLTPYKDPQTQCTPDTTACNCVVCCDTPVRDLWVTIQGATKYGSDPTSFVKWADWGDDGCPDAEGGSPGAGCTGQDCIDCRAVNGVYHFRLKRPEPDNLVGGDSDCCEWDFYQSTSTIPGPYEGRTDIVTNKCDDNDYGNIGMFLTICRDVRVCDDASTPACAGDTPLGTTSSINTRFLLHFSEDYETNYCFYQDFDQNDIDYGSGHDSDYCDDILENPFVLDSPLCAFDVVTLQQWPGCTSPFPAGIEKLCTDCVGPSSATATACYGMTSAEAIISKNDPGL